MLVNTVVGRAHRSWCGHGITGLGLDDVPYSHSWQIGSHQIVEKYTFLHLSGLALSLRRPSLFSPTIGLFSSQLVCQRLGFGKSHGSAYNSGFGVHKAGH